MGIFRQFPYTNFHEMNLDMLIKIVDDLSKDWKDFTIDWSKDVAEQVDKWLTEHPEATTTVLDGAISTNKLADGAVTFDKVSNNLLDGIYENLKIDNINDVIIEKNLLKNSSYGREFISRKPIGFYTNNDANYVWFQSAEYVDTTNHVILGFTSSDYTLGMLVEVSTDFETVYNRISGLSLGHLNDIAYNPNTNKLYIATMDTGSYANRIVVVSAASLVIETSIDIGKTVYQISYDRRNDLFYVGTNTNDIYDSDFNLIKTNPLVTASAYLNKILTGQGSCAYDGNFMLMSQDNYFAYIATYDYNNGNIEKIQEYRNSSFIDEPESLLYIPNVGVFILSGQRYVSVDMLKINEASSDSNMFDIFSNGVQIPYNSDLNDYVQPGKYFSLNAGYSATIGHVPDPCQNRGFSLYVLNQAYDWLAQIIIGSSVKKIIMFRTKEGTNNWGAWQWMIPKVEFLDPNPVDIGSSVSIPTDYINHYDEITIYMNRNYFSGSVTVPTAAIKSGDCSNGQCIFATHEYWWEFTISPSGVLTLTAKNGVALPYIRIICN